MKHALAGILIFVLSSFPLGSTFHAETGLQSPAPNSIRSAVVVELFTSEGCSSCPPADALLARLEDEQSIVGAEVIALEEHVDYWNQQGWTDPFSAVEWTLRQQDYAAVFKGDGVYTPQMIVDGRSDFIGSRVQEATAAIGEAARRTKTTVAITPSKTGDIQKPEFMVTIGKLEQKSEADAVEVWLAISERDLHSAVSRGENAGKELHHAAVLRSMKKIGTAGGSNSSPSFSGNVSLKVKPGWKRENLRVVVFAQEKKSKRILGAASLKITN